MTRTSRAMPSLSSISTPARASNDRTNLPAPDLHRWIFQAMRYSPPFGRRARELRRPRLPIPVAAVDDVVAGPDVGDDVRQPRGELILQSLWVLRRVQDHFAFRHRLAVHLDGQPVLFKDVPGGGRLTLLPALLVPQGYPGALKCHEFVIRLLVGSLVADRVAFRVLIGVLVREGLVIQLHDPDLPRLADEVLVVRGRAGPDQGR